MKKRIIASILTVIMLMTMLPTAAFAAGVEDTGETETGTSAMPTAASMVQTLMMDRRKRPQYRL